MVIAIIVQAQNIFAMLNMVGWRSWWWCWCGWWSWCRWWCLCWWWPWWKWWSWWRLLVLHNNYAFQPSLHRHDSRAIAVEDNLSIFRLNWNRRTPAFPLERHPESPFSCPLPSATAFASSPAISFIIIDLSFHLNTVSNFSDASGRCRWYLYLWYLYCLITLG